MRAPGTRPPAGAAVIDARGMLLHPGLINAHTHAHGNLAKGMGDLWTLELLLTAAPWISGNRSHHDRYLSAKIGAVEMVLKGCTAAYDLTMELPLTTAEGLAAVGAPTPTAGCARSSRRCWPTTRSTRRSPACWTRCHPPCAGTWTGLRLAPWKQSLASLGKALDGWTLDRRDVRLAIAPTIPHHCSDDFIRACAGLAKEHGMGLHSHVAESKVQAIVGLQRYGKTQTAHLDDLGALGPHFTVAHGVWLDGDDMKRLSDHGASIAHNPGSNSAWATGRPTCTGCWPGRRTSGSAPTGRTAPTT